MKTIIGIISLCVVCGHGLAQTNDTSHVNVHDAIPVLTNSVVQKIQKTFIAPPNDTVTNSVVKKSEKPLIIDGKVVKTVHIDKVQPDGLLISYTTTDGGLGMKIFYFENFPESVQKQYGYDSQKAAEFEESQKQSNAQVAQQMILDDDEAKVAIAERNLKEIEIREQVLKEQSDNLIKEQQLDTAQRIADAQERQANALEEQNFQQEQTQQKLDDIEWDLMRYKY